MTATLPAHVPQHTKGAALSPLHPRGLIKRSDLFIPKEETHRVPQNDKVTMISLLFTGVVVVMKHASPADRRQVWKSVFLGEKKKGGPNKE